MTAVDGEQREAIMIATVTVNPALDQTAWVGSLEVGGVNRVARAHLDPAGKGVNVSRMVHRLEEPTIAFGFVAGETGLLVEHALDTEGVQHHFVKVPGHTRINVTVIDGERRATSLYGPGPEIPPDRLRVLEDVVRFWMQPGCVLVLAGALVPGLDAGFYAECVRDARARGVKTIVDADGEALLRALPERPDVIKPNVTEAERILGRRLDGVADVLAAGQELRDAGPGTVVVSMGADGAVCVTGAGTWHVKAPRIERRSTVGSGDAMVAGLAIALVRGEPVASGVRLGAAAGAATAAAEGTSLGAAAEVRRLLPAVELVRLS